MTAQIIIWMLAGIAAVLVVGWATVSGPEYLNPYFERAGLRARTRVEYALISALPTAFVAVFGTRDPFLVATLPLVALFSLMVLIDATTKKQPNVLTFLAMAALVVGGVLGMIVRLIGFHHGTSLVGIAVGIVVWLFPLWLLNRVGGGVGLGDVKLAPVLGGWLGLYGAGVAFGGLLTAVIVGGIYALVLLTLGKVKWSSTVAFGPALVIGALVSWFVTGGAVSPW
ncbi:MAG: hypothetical protein Q4E01_01770 [Actinomycetaceae bacterium]|nr:hypothetical protein [Actinomycetaceae bacterium]